MPIPIVWSTQFIQAMTVRCLQRKGAELLKYKLKSTASQRTAKTHIVHHLTAAAFLTGGQF